MAKAGVGFTSVVDDDDDEGKGEAESVLIIEVVKGGVEE